MIRYPFEVKFAALSGSVSLAYVDEGAGDVTLLCIHGLANYLPVYRHTIAGLKDEFRVVAIDLPGNGLSTGTADATSLKYYVEKVAEFIQWLKPKNLVLCGHSMGGHVSLLLALKYPELVNRLVLIAPSGIEYFSSFEKIWLKNMMGIGSFLYSDALSLESAIRNSYFKRERTDAGKIISDLTALLNGTNGKMWRRMVLMNIHAMLDEEVFSRLPQISQKCLMIFGQQDMLIPNKLVHLHETPESIAMKGAAMIPDCRLELLPDTGHFAQIEAAEEVNGLIRSFLRAGLN